MKFTYSEFDGDQGAFLPPDALFPQKGVTDFILQYGQDGLDALDESDDPDGQLQRLIDEMIQAGLVERDEGGRLRLTPRMVRGMQHRAFLEIFRNLRPGVRDGHASPEPGARGERLEGAKPYQWGDALSEIDMGETLRQAIQRLALQPREDGGLLPIRLSDQDIRLFNVEAHADSALVILIDLSGSMARYGRHIAAKRVAMGMRSLIREKFPLDTVEFIGFASVAEEIRELDLPLVMPKPITTHQYEVRVRVPLDQAHLTHPHFTNLHHGLRLARRKLARSAAANKQVFIITDGEPTAHLSEGQTPEGATGMMLNLIYPPHHRSEEATLREALRCRQEGIRISTFALIEEYHGMDWVGFVDKLTRLSRGVAFYCAAGDLGATIMESYLAGKRSKRTLGA